MLLKISASILYTIWESIFDLVAKEISARSSGRKFNIWLKFFYEYLILEDLISILSQKIKHTIYIFFNFGF